MMYIAIPHKISINLSYRLARDSIELKPCFPFLFSGHHMQMQMIYRGTARFMKTEGFLLIGNAWVPLGH